MPTAETSVSAIASLKRIRVAMIGNPNSGKTTLFNKLCGLRQRTSNYPGTTQDARIGRIETAKAIELVDLPGAYSLDLESAESVLCKKVLEAEAEETRVHAVCVIIDAHNIPRGLRLVGEVARTHVPMVVAITMVDSAVKRGIHAEETVLAKELGCEVIACSSRTGLGVDALKSALHRAKVPHADRIEHTAIDAWVERVCRDIALRKEREAEGNGTDRADRMLTNPIVGLLVFLAIMGALFLAVFKFASYPMDWIDQLFAVIGDGVSGMLPTGILQDLLVNGVIAGVGATLVFLPQICILFFLITMLEDTGYLARAAFLMDRLLRPFGLTGYAFVPLLSSHACALPGIMAARGVPDKRDKLATILVAPFMSCTARIPVYVLLVGLLFPGNELRQALAFGMCYVLGIAAGILSSLVARRTILKGPSAPMALELPAYRLPNLRNAFLSAWDRGWLFVRNAGTVILMISIVLWWLNEYPHVDAPSQATQLRADAEVASTDEGRDDLIAQVDRIEAMHASRHSFLGRIGSVFQPVFAPLGYDRQLTVGVLASFAAREVFVSTMAVQIAGEDDADDPMVRDRIAHATRDDGTPVFTRATSWSLLVYYVFAMLCLPTVVLTAKEAGGWKWAFLQLGWMTLLAYVGAFIAFNVMS
ncbi:MAG: ferrous iron transporter B [Phycisphaeraceae bacterium]|nr:ferrous iron transporter B [Phycisphaerales bacterium]MCB9861071.1 ferrous iron transporter B [Phycisphaeraceae bacterium]